MKRSLKKFDKNVFFFCPSIEEGGVEKNLYNICNGLAKDLKLILITANQNKKKFFSKDVKFISPGNNFFDNKSRLIKSLVCFYLLLKNIKKNNLIFSFQSNIFAIIYSKILNCKIIIRPNAAPNVYAKNKIKRYIMSIIYSLADEIIVNSYDFKKEFKKNFKLNSLVVYNSIENKKKLEFLIKKSIKFNFFDKDKKSLKIISVGRLVKQKDHITILRSLNLIKKNKKFKFCLIGKGNQKPELEKYLDENKLKKFVKLIGYKKNIYPYLNKADIFILSSLYEGSPNTLIEASFIGLPIISTNCKTGPQEILSNQNHGKLFKIGDYKSLAELILKSKKKIKKKFFHDKRFNLNRNLNKIKKIIEQY